MQMYKGLTSNANITHLDSGQHACKLHRNRNDLTSVKGERLCRDSHSHEKLHGRSKTDIYTQLEALRYVWKFQIAHLSLTISSRFHVCVYVPVYVMWQLMPPHAKVMEPTCDDGHLYKQ